MLRIPIPLLIAAMVFTTAVVVYLNLNVISVPPVADGNFTGTLVAGSLYQWRAAASQVAFSTNATVQITHIALNYVVYVNGPIGNTTTGSVYLAKFPDGTAYLVVPMHATYETGGTDRYGFAYELVRVATVADVDIYTPVLVKSAVSNDKFQALMTLSGTNLRIVKDIAFNRTHAIITAETNFGPPAMYYIRLPEYASVSATATYDFNGVGFTYRVGNRTVSGFILPYNHFLIVPTARASVTIRVR